MRKVCLMVVASAFGASVAVAQESQPKMFIGGSWVCAYPEAYDIAEGREQETPWDQFEALKKDLLAEKLCMFVDEEDFEDMMAPWVTILDQQGDKVQVEFAIEFYDKIEDLHRRIERVRFTGWTAAANLENYYP